MTHLFDRGAGFLVVDELDRPIPSPESFSEEQWEFKGSEGLHGSGSHSPRQGTRKTKI